MKTNMRIMNSANAMERHLFLEGIIPSGVSFVSYISSQNQISY